MAMQEKARMNLPRNEGGIENSRSSDDQLMKVDCLPDGWSEIGKIAVSSKKIGEGCKGTLVYEGKYDGRLAAVKRLVRDCVAAMAYEEIEILITAARHENIVQYYGVEKDPNFVYLALELCTCNLDDLIRVHSDSSDNSAYPRGPASTKIKLRRADNYPSPQLMKLMRGMVLGLSHLHDSGIIHRDLKPQNVLITMNEWPHARLSDMGISRCLPEDKSSLGSSSTGCGTSGWRAPEVIHSGGRQTRAMDLFSLGCILFFCITCGKHPFGENLVRDYNIGHDKKNLSLVEFIPEAHDLISHLLKQEPELRPKASEVLHHPFFWSSETRLSFLCAVSNKVELENGVHNRDLLNALENTAQVVFNGTNGNWNYNVETEVMTNLRKGGTYDGSRVKDLLRAVRNVYSHHMEFPEEVKKILGPVPDGLEAYFATRFPRLLIESYKVVSQICKEEESFQEYFPR